MRVVFARHFGAAERIFGTVLVGHDCAAHRAATTSAIPTPSAQPPPTAKYPQTPESTLRSVSHPFSENSTLQLRAPSNGGPRVHQVHRFVVDVLARYVEVASVA